MRGYRLLLTYLSGWTVLVSFLARLPGAMGPLGALLLVSTTADSLGAGGASAAAVAIGSAVGGPVAGRLADLLGQRRVLLTETAANAVLTVAVVLAAVSGAPLAAVLVLSAGMGLSAPQIGAMARARWISLTRDADAAGDRVATALSLEGALDETSFVVGPALVGVLASLTSPGIGLTVAAGLVAAFGTAFALHPSAPGRSMAPGGALPPVRSVALGTLVLAMALVGVVFGSTQAGVTAVATAAGSPGLAGLVYALLGLTSAVAGAASAAIPARIPLLTRLRATSIGLLVLTAPLLLAHSVPGVAVGVGAAGCVIAPYLITVYGLGERAAPRERLSEALTLIGSGVVLGYAVGSAVGGQLAERVGSTAGFVPAVAAAAGTVVLSWAGMGAVTDRLRPVPTPGPSTGRKL